LSELNFSKRLVEKRGIPSWLQHNVIIENKALDIVAGVLAILLFSS